MTKITIDQFCSHWVGVKGISMPIVSRFQYNIFDFTTAVGEHTKRCFIDSFEQGGFYGSGNKWAPRESRWGRKFTHPVMLDTEALKNSIKGEQGGRERMKSANRLGNITRMSNHYVISTNELSKAIKGKRGRTDKSIGYAAIHNTDPIVSNFTVNQYSGRKPVQRQFIGISPKINDHVFAELTQMLFKGFPQ